MKIFQMNEIDSVLHHTYEEAIAYYDSITGVFNECRDDSTGDEYAIEAYEVLVNEPGDKPLRMTVEKALKQNEIEFPAIFSSEQ